MLGKNEQTLSFQVVPAQATEKYHIDVDGLEAENDETKDELTQESKVKLAIEEVEISTLGKMTLSFNKPILDPQIKIGSDASNSGSRSLSNGLFDIREAMDFLIRNADEDRDLDKSIEDVTLDRFEEQTMEMSLKFSEPKSITRNIAEPDILEIFIKMPQLFVDAETFEYIED